MYLSDRALQDPATELEVAVAGKFGGITHFKLLFEPGSDWLGKENRRQGVALVSITALGLPALVTGEHVPRTGAHHDSRGASSAAHLPLVGGFSQHSSYLLGLPA